jgi:hypothetical protein
MHNDPAHGVAGFAVTVEQHFETQRRRHIPRRVFAVFWQPPLAGCDQRARKKISIGKTLAEVGRYRGGLARLRLDGKDGVGVLARDVQTAVVAELHVEGWTIADTSLAVTITSAKWNMSPLRQ